MLKFIEQTFTIRNDIGQLNEFAQKAKQVAITAINPVFTAGSGADSEAQRRDLMALRIQVEGPTQSVNYFKRLMEGGNLNFDA